MADGKSQNTSSVNPGPLVKGMQKDLNESYSPPGTWFHAVNAMPNSREGDLGTLANEPSNLLCATIPYTVIGTIHMHKDVWAIFSTDDTNSQIGIFNEGTCEYTPLRNCNGDDMNPVNCLGFKRTNLIKGAAKENFDCTWQVYFADGLNPDRTVNMDKPAFVEICRDENNTILPGPPNYITVGCITCICTDAIDCDALRLHSLAKTPCLRMQRGPNGGNLLNGSYYALAAYTLNSQKVTDYFLPSNIQSIFEHDNASGSLLITLEDMDTDNFDYFELVIVRTFNQQTSAKKMGIYSTRQAQIFVDAINEALTSVPLELIPLRTPTYDKSDAIYEVGDYLLRVGPTTKFDFNYQPLANQITAKWKATNYPANYYGKAGNNTSYLRDEIYPFFIRWVYDTGEKSSSYHIPGRPSRAIDLGVVGNSDAIELQDPIAPYMPQKWEVYNTAPGSVAVTPPIVLPDGGVVVAEGEMGYWESTEQYPDTKAIIFNASGLKDPSDPTSDWAAITTLPYPGTTIDQYDLCGKPIRHHKFPDNNIISHTRTLGALNPLPNAVTPAPGMNGGDLVIQVLGVEFGNILPPLDNQGNLIPGIVGYEILRGSREGNKTVIAKGIINNMRRYTLDNGQQGLYQNYPYNSLQPDPSLTPIENQGENPIFQDHGALSGYSQDQFTFHSPDTSFNNPFLSSKELKLYGELSGLVTGSFDEQPGHPKHKLVTDTAFVVAAIVGIGAAVISLRGKTTRNFTRPVINRDDHGFQTVPGVGVWGINDAVVGFPAILAAQGILNASFIAPDTAFATSQTLGGSILSLLATGNDIPLETYRNALNLINLANASTIQLPVTDTTELTPQSTLPNILRVANAVPIFSHYWTLGTDAAMELITALIPYTQYAMRYTSHADMIDYIVGGAVPGNTRRLLTNSIYLDDQFQEFGTNNNARINNLYRSKCVALQTQGDFNDPTETDNTLQTIGTASALPGSNVTFAKPKAEFNTNAVSYYAALKQRMRNQYGQVDSIIQVPASFCTNIVQLPMVPGTPVISNLTLNGITTLVNTSGPIFGGDTYITRYTEKNTFFYFWDWLYEQPDGYEFDYKLRYMLNFPRYWADFTKFDVGAFLNSFITGITTFSFSDLQLPSKKHSLDGNFLPGFSNLFNAIFRVTERYFYTFNSGVRDFYVESEINTALRDWGDIPAERFYDPYRYSDRRQIFDPKIIKSGNFFKYDQSLSISRVFNNFFSWGNTQERDYNPIIAETCYSYYPNRTIYSLPQNLEARKDFWRVFLANNYKDFKTRVTAIKSIGRNGAMLLFQTESPVMFQGVDTLQTDAGTKITIGDGGLFSQPLQNIVNTDASYEYGSCQDRLSIINTKYGLFWISQNQGKIFNYTGQLNEISKEGIWFWLATYLPYKLVEDFPDFELLDNPVIGIGCQTIYDNQEDTIYFTKKDWKLKPQFIGQITYVGADNFLLNGTLPVKLGNLLYFDDASWTLSYDPKDKYWIGYHDWHPDLTMPGKNEFLSIIHDPVTSVGTIWRHNARTDSFCNFYGIDYPFLIDRIAPTGINVTTIRSIEYYLEAYIYKSPTDDIYEVLDANFDHAIIYNREQVSGVLILNQMPKNNIVQSLLYPIINPTSIDILCDKVEQKFRINQFWDITDDRGEFTFPNVQRPIWITSINGYNRTLNPANLNYNKNSFQRKKFRHLVNHVQFYKNISGNINYICRMINVKELASLR